MTRERSFWLFLGAACLHLSASAATLRVPEKYPTIQSAVAVAKTGDTVLVSEGKYFENVVVRTAISLQSVAGPKHTVIDGQRNGSVVQIEAGNVRVAGFTVRNGYASYGGGINVTKGPTTIEDCWILNNIAGESGGGVRVTYSDATVRNNRIADNGATSGGGMSVSSLSHNTVAVEANIIEDNSVDRVGAGLAVSRTLSGRIVGNVIRRNETGFEGTAGGMGIYFSGGLLVANNLIVDNYAAEVGGVYWYANQRVPPTHWVNNTVAHNHSGEFGPDQLAMYGETGRNVLVNNILAGEEVLRCRGRPTFRHNNVFGFANGRCAESATHRTNKAVDPRFADSRRGHPYHLSSDSPLIDAGSNRHALEAGLETDLGGRPRIIEGRDRPRVDMGAFEYRPPGH